jgi:toxin FitB
MIVLDTNVISALMNIGREPAVAEWFTKQDASRLHITTPVMFEIHYGIACHPDGARKREIARRFANVISQTIGNRILPFDEQSAAVAATIYALKANRGRVERVVDIQIAGIAKALNAHVATRNVKDFKSLGVKIINPWVHA